MSASPLGSAGIAGASIGPGAVGLNPAGAVWVLEDARRRAPNAGLAIAERLGLEFRRVPLLWNLRAMFACLHPHGSLAGLQSPLPLTSGAPLLTLSAGRRSAAVAAWLKHACGSRMVHYGDCGFQRASIDLHLRDCTSAAADPPGHFAVLGQPHRLTATMLQAAYAVWHPRLDHLPRPRLALIVGSGPFGAELQPSEAARLAAALSRAVNAAGGAILAITDRRTGREATDALAAGLSNCLNLIYREGEPGPDPELGFLSVADAIVVAGHAPGRLLRACALTVPVYVSPAGPVSGSQRALQQRLFEAGHIRPLDGEIEAFTRMPLDEAGRAAHAVRELLRNTDG
jgi:mitochondrial fission protein ELM1